eukprot:symbB.v1.2.003670.t1/scaffold175.1/size369221/26
MALTFSVSTVNGTTYDISCSEADTVHALRINLETNHIEVPEACYLKLFHGAEVLADTVLVKELDPTQPIFAVNARETRVEALLEAAGSYWGYKELLKKAPSTEGDHVKIVKGIPSILAVLEEPRWFEHLKMSGDGMEMSSVNGYLLLPSISLGVVLKEPASMQSDVDESGIPKFVYNGFGLSDKKNSNAIKFHPGMGQLRVEGAGGFNNKDMGYTPANWTESGKAFHTFQVTIGTDGKNLLKVTSTRGEVFEIGWENTLTDGKFTPSLHARLIKRLRRSCLKLMTSHCTGSKTTENEKEEAKKRVKGVVKTQRAHMERVTEFLQLVVTIGRWDSQQKAKKTSEVCRSLLEELNRVSGEPEPDSDSAPATPKYSKQPEREEPMRK